MKELIDRLDRQKRLELAEWTALLSGYNAETADYAAQRARALSLERFGKRVYFRGIVEFTNICRNDCLYCGLRRSNTHVGRYRLEPEEILACCREGYALGYRTFVLQGGEDPYYTDQVLCQLVSRITGEFPDAAVTLSVGERCRASYQRLFDAGARRYLLRHETAAPELYRRVHPPEMSWENRMRCLRDLREIGYQTGCGMMVGLPGQTAEDLGRDMIFMEQFRPQMIGMGPFLPHHDTPLRDCPAGSVELTLFLLSLCRIMLPDVLLPATTALDGGREDGRTRGILAGANVIMPNLSPVAVRKDYLLYDGKPGLTQDAADSLRTLREAVTSIGYELVIGRGDYGEWRNSNGNE